MSERVNHEGETKIANNGLKMTIIKYRKYKDIDIRFEGGAIVRHKRYDNFLAGRIRHPKVSSHRNRIIDRTGETNRAHNGKLMTIIKYRNTRDIDVQFEDDYVVKHTSYKCFKNGHIKHPSEK